LEEGAKWMEERRKKKTETSLMLLVAVNKFQPKKFPQRKKRRKQRGRVAGKKRNVCEEAVLFLMAFNSFFCRSAQPGTGGDEN
jgi:hypothetical protein